MFPAERIRLLRTEAGLTQGELSKYLGIERSTLTKYETGERRPDMEQLCKIADFFGASVEYLIGRDDAADICSLLEGPSVLTYKGKILTKAQRKALNKAIEKLME